MKQPSEVNVVVPLPLSLASRVFELSTIHSRGDVPQFLVDLIEKELDQPTWARKQAARKGTKT